MVNNDIILDREGRVSGHRYSFFVVDDVGSKQSNGRRLDDGGSAVNTAILGQGFV